MPKPLTWNQIDTHLFEAEAGDAIYIIERSHGCEGYDAVVCRPVDGTNELVGSRLSADGAKMALESAAAR